MRDFAPGYVFFAGRLDFSSTQLTSLMLTRDALRTLAFPSRPPQVATQEFEGTFTVDRVGAVKKLDLRTIG